MGDQNEAGERGHPADGLACHPVSRAVNTLRNDDPRLIERVPEPVAELPKGKTPGLF